MLDISSLMFSAHGKCSGFAVSYFSAVAWTGFFYFLWECFTTELNSVTYDFAVNPGPIFPLILQPLF